MLNLVNAEWTKVAKDIPAEAPEEYRADCQYWFYAGAQAMWSLVMQAPNDDVGRALRMNELQRELLEYIHVEKPADQNATTG